jgi:hypothetical protein
MSQEPDAVQLRVTQIVAQERGKTGLGPQAAALYLPATRFRPAVARAPLREAAFPMQAFDRAWHFRAISLAPFRVVNSRDGQKWMRLTFAVETGVVYGKGNESLVYAGGTGESAAEAVLNPGSRAVADGERIAQILTLPDATRGVALTGISILDVDRVGNLGAVDVFDLGDGKLIGSTLYEAKLRVQNLTANDP